MKSFWLFLTGLILFQGSTSFAAGLFTPPNVVGVNTEIVRDKTGNETIYRATVFSGGEEGSVTLGLEKFIPGEYGSPVKVVLQKKFRIPELPGFKPLLTELRRNQGKPPIAVVVFKIWSGPKTERSILTSSMRTESLIEAS